MSKKSEISDIVANSMAQLLEDDKFVNIFHPKSKVVSTELKSDDKEAITGYQSFEQFVSLAKKKKDKKEKDTDKPKDDEDKDKDAKDKDKDKDVKNKKKNWGKNWGKKAKASNKCNCNSDCSCKDGKKCQCDGCIDCAACGDSMYVSAIKYIVESFTRTSEALDNMGLEKSAIATMVTLNHIIEEIAESKYASNTIDENDVRGMDLLLGLEDDEAITGFEDESLDDPSSSAVLEDILTKSPELAETLSESLKSKFETSVGNQLKDRVRSRLENISDADPNETDIEELAANRFPPASNPGNRLLQPINDLMKDQQDEELGGTPTIPAENNEWSGKNVTLDQLNVEDAEIVQAFNELNDWVKESNLSSDDVEFNHDDLDNMLETFVKA